MIKYIKKHHHTPHITIIYTTHHQTPSLSLYSLSAGVPEENMKKISTLSFVKPILCVITHPNNHLTQVTNYV